MTIQEILNTDSENDKRLKINSNFEELDERSEGLEGGLEDEVVIKLSNDDGDFQWRNAADNALKGDPGDGSAARWDPVLVATTANITLSGAQTVDGISVVASDRVLVKSQSTGSQNGIYVCAAGTWTRATDANQTEEFVTGKFVHVNSGTLHGGQFFSLTTTGTIIVDTTSLAFAVAPAKAAEDKFGISRIATQVEVDAGTSSDTEAFVNAFTLAAYSGITNKLLITDFQVRDAKDSVRVATTAAGTLASSFENGDTIDGVTLATNDRILIKDQASGAENGIYTVNASGAPTRATDANTSAKVTPQMAVRVEAGTANGSRAFCLSNTGSITLGSTSLTFIEAVLGATETGTGVVELATDAETQTGTDTSRAITPANLSARTATETRTGVVELATDAETQTGTDTARAITPANLTARSASETRTGVVELATDAETQTGTDTSRAITPSNLSARSANETRSGVAEVATQGETDTGTDDQRMVTPAKLANYSGVTNKLLITDYQARDLKDSVRAATTAAGTLASSFENGDTVDGVTLATNDRILIKDQASGAENGLYTVNASGAPTRSSDANTSAKVTPQLLVRVEEGTANQNKGFYISNTGTINLGVTALVFAEHLAGADGADAYSTTGASFTQPAASSTVSVQVDSTEWMGVDQILYVEGGGYYSVDTVTDGTNVVLENLAYPGNAAESATVSTAARVSPGGLRGATGATGDVSLAMYESRDAKDSVRVATTASGTLASSFENGDTVDGITLATGDRILLKNQSTASQNGIYTVNASGAPTRATDADTDAKVTPQMFVRVEEGTANANKVFYLATTGSITLDTTSLTFSEQISSAYTTVAEDASDLTQRSKLNFGSNITAVDNSGASRTDVTVASASESGPGVIEIATTSEVTVATDDVRSITPLKLGKDQTSGVAALNSSRVVDTARLGSGSATSSTYLRGDSTWATVSAGFTPAWVTTGAGSLYVARGDGDPNRSVNEPNISTAIGNSFTPTNLSTTRVLMVRFRLPKDLSVSNVRSFAAGASTNILNVAIYETSVGGNRLWTSGTFSTTTSAWLNITANLPVSLTANTNYWFAISTTAASSTNVFNTLPVFNNAAFWGSASGNPLAGRSIGLPEYAQFATTSGSLPSTLGTLVDAAIGCGVPVFYLEGTAS